LGYDWLPMIDELFSDTMVLHHKSASTECVFSSPEGEVPFIDRQRRMRCICSRGYVITFRTAYSTTHFLKDENH
jgi:hypothetical protein